MICSILFSKHLLVYLRTCVSNTCHKIVWQRCVYLASDGGRVCRPLVIADKGVSRIKEHHMKELRVCVFIFVGMILCLIDVLIFYFFSIKGWSSCV